MLPHPRGQVVPTLELRHQPPKTIRPSSSPRRLAASGSCSLRKRSARAKNCCCFCFSASIPFSINSNNMRFLLSFRLLAMLPTCFATLGGRLTLWRTAFSATFMTPLCTKTVHEGFERLNQRRSRRPPPMPKSRKKRRSPERVLALPDLEQSKTAVLNSLTSRSGQRSYDHAITDFVEWYCSEPRLAFNRTVVLRYRTFLEQKPYAPTTINLRLAAVRRVALRLLTPV